MTPTKLQSFLRLSFWLACGAVVAGSLTPAAHLPPLAFDLWDKAQHALAFAVLTVLGLGGYGPARYRPVCVGLLGFGAGIELAQWLSGWRHGDLLDLSADGVGIAAGLVCYRLWRACGIPAGMGGRKK